MSPKAVSILLALAFLLMTAGLASSSETLSLLPHYWVMFFALCLTGAFFIEFGPWLLAMLKHFAVSQNPVIARMLDQAHESMSTTRQEWHDFIGWRR
jgi:hypothetical protein